MSVRIPVSADAAAAVKAFQDIQRAIERTGQSAKDLAKIDLSHPELKGLANDIRRIEQNLDSLLNTANGSTAATARRLNDASFVSPFAAGGMMDVERWRRLHPDGTQGDRRFVNASRYILSGTNFAMHQPPATVPPGGAGAGGMSLPGFSLPSSGGMAGGMGRAVMSGGAWMLGMAGVGAVAGMAARAVSQAQEEAVANDTLMRTLRDLDTDFSGLRRSVRDATTGLGLTYQEAQRLSLAWVRATNETEGERATSHVRFAVGAARSLGMEPGSMVGGMGRAAFMGEDPRRFALLLAETMRDSGMTGQGEQVMGQLLRWTEGLTRSISDPRGLELAAGMYSTLSSSGNPGLRGEFGAALMDRMNASLTQGGAAGDASMHLTYRAMARHGVTDPYQIQHILAGGMFERVGGRANAPTVYEASMGEINRLYAGLPEHQRWHAMGRHLGISPRQAQAIEGARGRGGNLGRLGAELGALGIAPGSMNPTALGEAAEVAGTDNLGEWRTRLGRNNAIPQGDRDRLASLEGEDLRREMIRLLARHGGTTTDGENVRETVAQMGNALTAAGTGLVPVLNDMRDVLSDLGQTIGTLSETLGDVYSGFVGGDPAARARLEARRQGAAVSGITPGTLLTGEQEEQRARFIYEEGIRRGLTPEQAAGVVAQGRAESNFRHDAVGDGGRARGVFQHHPDRRRAMEAQFRLPEGGFAGASFEDQVRMSYWELLEGPERAAGAALRRTNSAGEAGSTLSRLWERPRDATGEALRRAGAARALHERLRGGGGASGRTAAAQAAYDAAIRAGMTPEQAADAAASVSGTPSAAPAPAMPGASRAPDAGAAAGQQQTFNIAPLRVIHENTAGAMLGEDILPVTQVGGDARAAGLA